jgi:2-polyprenyl-3-methyl-5-hydroxy-6-metoxy-1,4-benzoquinol methylase
MTSSKNMSCNCGSAFLKKTFEYVSRPDGEMDFGIDNNDYRRRYMRCTVCEHWFSQHEIDLSKLYESRYLESTYGGVEGLKSRYEKIISLPQGASDNVLRCARIQAFAKGFFGPNFVSARHSVLDVGGGIGVFAREMKRYGWRVSAIEQDLLFVNHLRDTVGVEALHDDLLELSPGDIGSFDVISFNKVLEHIQSPVPLLVHARNFLKAEGFVYVELPDVEAAADGPGREEFFIEHFHVFSPASITLLLERSGFKVVTIERLRDPSGKFTLRAFGTSKEK